ncbi:hypothetical protein HY992_03500 [Candidatus Micrarchaeota archaeon]|nr:hypothetical protein [Candidatus Micrarchaeota archaeon]
MGLVVASEIAKNYVGRVKITSAVDAPNSPLAGKLVPGTGVRVSAPSKLGEALKQADCVISFATPEAEAENIEAVTKAGKNIVVATTGFSEQQRKTIEKAIFSSSSSAVISPNFSPLVNVQFFLSRIAAEKLASLGYEFGVLDEHHSAKKDSPSGTAKKIVAELEKGGAKNVQVHAFRLGGTPGIHDVHVVGANGRLSINSLMYNRADFARGAIEAALWLEKNKKKGKIFGMDDLLGLSVECQRNCPNLLSAKMSAFSAYERAC